MSRVPGGDIEVMRLVPVDESSESGTFAVQSMCFNKSESDTVGESESFFRHVGVKKPNYLILKIEQS